MELNSAAYLTGQKKPRRVSIVLLPYPPSIVTLLSNLRRVYLFRTLPYNHRYRSLLVLLQCTSRSCCRQKLSTTWWYVITFPIVSFSEAASVFVRAANTTPDAISSGNISLVSCKGNSIPVEARDIFLWFLSRGNSSDSINI